MSGYVKPKNRFHREFLYLNHDTVLNSLSAMEAGDIDAIIQKAIENKDGGAELGVSGGPVTAKAGKKKSASIQEELVRTRTNFSAFDSWFKHLVSGDAIGRLQSWDLQTRSELQIGDTLEFDAAMQLTPVHKLFKTFVAFSGEVGKQHSPFHQKPAEQQETKKIARMMSDWLGVREAKNGEPGVKGNLTVYLAPTGIAQPRMIARLDEQYIVGKPESVEGQFHIVAQVERILGENDEVSPLRILRDVPPTQLETSTMATALESFVESGAELGVEVLPEDLAIGYPAVVLHPIAIFR